MWGVVKGRRGDGSVLVVEDWLQLPNRSGVLSAAGTTTRELCPFIDTTF
jgi:hypothetical protein